MVQPTRNATRVPATLRAARGGADARSDPRSVEAHVLSVLPVRCPRTPAASRLLRLRVEGVMADNKFIVRKSFEELFSDGKLDVADEVFAKDYVGHDPAMPKEIRGPEEFKQFV